MADLTAKRRKLTPPQYAARLGVSPDKVVQWIKLGELRAIDVSNGHQRPRYLIDLDDITAFEAGREIHAAAKRIPRKRQTDRGPRSVREFLNQPGGGHDR